MQHLNVYWHLRLVVVAMFHCVHRGFRDSGFDLFELPDRQRERFHIIGDSLHHHAFVARFAWHRPFVQHLPFIGLVHVLCSRCNFCFTPPLLLARCNVTNVTSSSCSQLGPVKFSNCLRRKSISSVPVISCCKSDIREEKLNISRFSL